MIFSFLFTRLMLINFGMTAKGFLLVSLRMSNSLVSHGIICKRRYEKKQVNGREENPS